MISTDDIKPLKRKVSLLKKKLDLDSLDQSLRGLQKQSQDPNLWSDQTKAKKVLAELSGLEETMSSVKSLDEKILELSGLLDLFTESQDDQVETEAVKLHQSLLKDIKDLELHTYLSGKYDSSGAIISIHSGQGGTEAMDWAAMLQRMYQRFFDLKGWKWQLVSVSPGEEAGIKSATIMVNAKYTYGYLKNEAGTHRLVRLSPFNADNLRQTSFAGVEVLPIVEDGDSVSLHQDDLEVEFFRSGGPGGQNVNKLSTAVRLKHKPSGLVVECQTQRTQEQNRKIATQILSSKLETLEQEKRDKELKDIKGKHKVPGWGQQIRSYVLHPYKQVKDHRTDLESQNPDAVLDGDLNDFIEASLSKK
jgi:peptide chain release factor 2